MIIIFLFQNIWRSMSKSINPLQLKHGKKYMIKHDVSGKIYRELLHL